MADELTQSIFSAVSKAQQVLLGEKGHVHAKHPPTWIGKFDTLFLLPLLILLSLFLLAVHFVFPTVYKSLRNRLSRTKPYQPIFTDDEDFEAAPVAPRAVFPSEGLFKDFTEHVKAIGVSDFLFEVIRVACLAALCGLSIYAAIISTNPDDDKATLDAFEQTTSRHKKHKHRKNKHRKAVIGGHFSTLEWEELGLVIFYLYVAIIAFMTLVFKAKSPLRRWLAVHRNLLLVVAWFMFAYRDLYPLATFHLRPIDTLHGPHWLTWVRFGLLSACAVVVPLFKPRKYIPVDPSNPQSEPHPEQTASWISIIFYQFMNPLIVKAWKVDSLDYEELPPMTDYDRAYWLSEKNMGKLDPVKRKQMGLKKHHLFVGLIQTFWKDYCILVGMIIIKTIADFLAPIGINRLLTYFSSNGQGAQIRPWVWVLWLFLGPTVGSLAFQFYIYTITRLLVRFEAMFTELLFTHSLRIKMRDDTSNDTSSRVATPTGSQTPEIVIEDTTDVANGHPEVAASTHDGLVVATAINLQQEGNSNVHKSNGKATSVKSKDSKKKKQDEAEKPKQTGDLVGRINTLISSDIDNVVEGRGKCSPDSSSSF